MTLATRNLLLLLASIACLVVAALIGFNVVHSTYALGWGFTGLAAFVAAFAVSRAPR